MEDSEFYVFDTVHLEVKDFDSNGLILDIGGGGEGVIGRLKGQDVVAIDIRKDELEEAVDGPLKIMMDARELKFLDESFHTATAFFSMMYMKTREDHQKVLQEAWRVLKPGGRFYLWEIDLAERPVTDKEFYCVMLRYRVGDFEMGTGYGTQWPYEPRGEAYYMQLAEEAGFQHLATERIGHILYFVLAKKGEHYV